MQTQDVSKRIAELSPEKRALLRRRLQEQQPDAGRPPPTLSPLAPDAARRHEPFPLTDIQQVYWAGRSGFLDLSAPGTNFYQEFELAWEHNLLIDRINLTLQRAIKRLIGRNFLDLDAYKSRLLLKRLDQAMQRVIARHDMLRAVMLPDGQQRILSAAPPSRIKVLDLRGRDPQSVERELENTRARMCRMKGAIDRWPLFEVLVHRLEGERLRVHMRIDTLLMDGISRGMFVREWLQQLLKPDLPPLECSYRDYAMAWTALPGSELYQRSRDYWLRRLPAMPPPLELPLTQPITPQTPSAFASRSVTLLAPHAWQRFKNRAAQAELTASGAVAAVFVEVLSAWSASPRFSISIEGTYRPPIHPQIGDILGNFNTIHVLAVEPASGTFEARARRLQQQMLADLEHRFFSGFQVLRELRRLHGGRAVMPVLFNSVIEYSHPSYLQDAGNTSGTNSLLSYRAIAAELHIPQVLLLPTHSESRDGALICNWQVAEAAFPSGMIDDMLAAYTALLQRLADQEEAWQEATYQLAPPAQLAQQAALNATQAHVPAGLLHTLFRAQVCLRPYQAAVVTSDQTLSYLDLERRSTSLSCQLRELGARPNTLVAVVMEPGWEQVVAVMSVLYAGAAYLPIDPSLPAERIRTLLEHVRVGLVLTQSCLDQHLAWPESIQRLCVDTIAWTGGQDYPLDSMQDQGDVAYVIYTCDTDEAPRGVMIDHRAVVNTISDINRRFGVGPADRVLALSPLHSDLAVYDLFGTLAAGGTLVLPDTAAVLDPTHWAELIVREQVTIWNGTPALLDRLIAYVADRPELHPRSLRLALLSRGWVPLTLPDRLRALVEGVVVVSLGGAPQAAIWSTCYPIETVDPAWTRIPYGAPLQNQRAHVLNAALEPCPTWVVGQLYLGGIGLAPGYWRDAARTRADFVAHPRTGERLYRTGDIGRYLPGGAIELLGRPEEVQATVYGYQIDLRRIEALLEQHPQVHQAVVVAREERLVAYIVPTNDQRPTTNDRQGDKETRRQGDSDHPARNGQRTTDNGQLTTDNGQLTIDNGQLTSDLRDYLRNQLPSYMLPSAFVALDELPLTPDARVDRRALPMPDTDGHRLLRTSAAPRDPLEQQLVQIWEALFDRRPIGVSDNFFALGGNSFMVVRLLAQIQAVFGQDLPLATFLHGATIEHMARILREGTEKQLAQKLQEQAVSLVRATRTQPAPSGSAHAESAVEASTSAAAQAGRGMRTFLTIWFGQLVSQIGSGLTAFALSVWVFQQTGSATQLALIGFFGIVPIILFSPLAGALVDRWDRRRAMILSDAGAALGTVAFVALLVSGLLQVWHIYIIVIVASIFRAFQFPAHSAATTQLVPKEQLGRASGLVQLSQGISQLVSPVLAGVLVGIIGLGGVILIDFITFLCALATLLAARIPRPAATASGRAGRGTLMSESVYGLIYILERPGLLGLLLFFAASNFMVGTVLALSTPLLLSFTTPAALGTVLSVAGVGMLAGGLVMSIWGGPQRRVYGVFAGVLLSGVCIIIAGLAPSALLIGAAAFFFTAGMPIMASASQAIWQRKVAPDVQGRVFAIRSMIATASVPLAYLLCGPLADYVFNPLLVQGGPLAGSVGQIIGVGPGRGIGLLFILLGLLTIVAVAVGYLSPRLRMVEEELPDAIADETPAQVVADY